jgi:predicted TIM-barrel fold metal-dependent hydrolase
MTRDPACVIIDIHTHIFPPEVIAQREEYLARDAGFREMYAEPKARMATVEELLASMDGAGIDRSVAVGFAWADAALCRAHNDYLLDASLRANGRIVPFGVVQPADPGARDEIERLAAAGVRGLGELRPEQQGYRLDGTPEAALLAAAAREHGMRLLFHVSEPVGHVYPGKRGLSLAQFGAFVAAHPEVTVIGAHWGGGLPFYALAPEVRAMLSRVYVDTAATRYLYRPDIYRLGCELLGAEHVLFGSDFPLLGQNDALADLRDAPLDDEARALVLGGNAARLLGLA